LSFRQINVAIVGAGWVGGIRANTCTGVALVDELHIAEINPERGAEVAAETGAARLTDDWREFLDDITIDAIIIASTPESSRLPPPATSSSLSATRGASIPNTPTSIRPLKRAASAIR